MNKHYTEDDMIALANELASKKCPDTTKADDTLLMIYARIALEYSKVIYENGFEEGWNMGKNDEYPHV